MSSVTEKYGTNLLNPLATNTNKADYKINELNTAINNFQKNASVTNDAAIIADLSVDVANKLENAKNYISDDVYKNIQNQLISYRSASNQQRINQEIRQNLIEKNKAARESAADRIGSIVKNKMVSDTATALDLLELQQLEQQGVKADSTVVSDVQKHLLGQETSDSIFTQYSSLKPSVEEIESKYNLPKNPKNAEAPLDWVDQLLPNLREEMESLEYLEKNGGLTEEEKEWYNEVKQQIADFETYKKIKPAYETKKEAKLLSYDISNLSYEDRLIEYENALKSGDELYAGYIDEHKYDGLSYDKLLEIEEQLKEKATPVYDYVDIDEATDALGPLIAQKNKYDELINRGIDLGEQQEYYDDIVRQISEIEKFIEAYNAGEVVDVEAANKELKSFQRDVLYYAKHEHELDTLGDIGDDFIEAIKENQDAKNFKVRFSSHDKIEEIKKEIIDSGIMTKEEVNNLKYYIKSQYQGEKNKSEMEDVFADVSQYNDLQEIGMTLWSVPNTFGGNILSLFDSIYQVTREFFGGEVRPVNPYSDINASAQYAKTIREAVMADQSDTEKFFYGIGCSLLDMGASIAASGGIGDSLTKSITGKAVAGSLTKNATLASMSLSAGGGSAIDTMEKTSNPYEVAAVGVSAAVFEALAEKLSLDNLFKIAGQGGKITSSMILKAMGSQAASEFGEEAATETANIIMEAVVLNDKSDWSQTVQYYIDEGYSKSEARGKALVSMIGRVGMSGLAGAISGGVTGGGASTINYLSYNYSLNSTGKTLIKNNQVERLIELAETSGIDISAYNLDGKKGNYNAKAVGELYFELMRNKSDAVSNALKEMGVSEADISIVQSAMLRESAGQPLSSEMQAKYSQYEDVIKHSFEDESSNLSVAANDYLLMSLLVDIARPKAPNNSTDVSGTDSADVDFDTNIDTDVNIESNSDIDTATESEIAEVDYLDNETLESVEENEYDKTIRLMDGRAKPLTEAQAYVQSVGRALGYTVVIDDLSRGGRTASGKSFKATTRGFFDGQTIYLHEGHTTFEAIVEIFKHEITHYAELNPKMYEKYADAVFNSKVFENWISEQKVDGEKVKGRSHPVRLGQYRESIIKEYAKHGVSLESKNDKSKNKSDGRSPSDCEIIANFTSEMLFNEKGNTLERFINEVNSEDRNAISRFIHDFISWLKARLKGEKVSIKIVKLENRFAAVLRNVDNANAQKNNTTNDGDVQNLSADKSVGYYSSQEQNIERTNAGLDDSAFSMPENDDKTNHSFEITPEQDAEYQRYVESWNKESAQKMVDEKAKNKGAVLDENGNPLKLYRGTMGGQTVFAKETTLNGKIYTIDNIDVASGYGDKSGKATEIVYQTDGEKTTYALYGFPKKMLTIDAQYGVWSDLVVPNELLKYADGRYKATNGEIAEWAELEGYDSLRINNVRDGSFDVGNEIIFFDENLVKSADPITYDDKGNVIPLSERFNEDNNDIRYSFEDNERYTEYDKPITTDDIHLLRKIGRKSINEFTPEEIEITQKWAYKFYQQLGTKSPFFRRWFGDWREYERSNFIDVLLMENRDGKNPRGAYTNNDTGWEINSSSVGYDETISHSGKDKKSIIAMKNIDKIIENAVLLDTEISEYGRGKKSVYTAFMHKFYAPIKIDGKIYLVKMAVDESHAPGQNDTNKKFYHVRAIKIETASSVGIGESHTPIIENTVSNISISNLFNLVKTYDTEFKPNPVNEALINKADGTPKVFYHGTNAQFTEFDKKKSKPGFYGRGFYFTTEKSQANVYGNEMPVYLNIKKPLKPGETSITKTQIANFLEAVAENEDYSIENYGTYNIAEILRSIESRDAFDVIQDINATAIGDFGEAMQLFNEVNGTSFDGVITSTETVVYERNQIKSAADGGNIGTFSEAENDIRYSFEDDVVDKTSSLAERVRLGEISQAEYLNELQQLMNEATEKYGAIPKGENPKVDVTVPRQVSDKRNTRRFVRTVLESGTLTDEMVADTDEAILKDALSYVPISNEEAIKVAANSLKNGTAERDWNKIANGDKIPSKHDIAKGEILLKMHAENGDTLKVMELVADLSEVATRAGQSVQAFSLLKKMSGVGKLYYIQKTVDKLNRDLEKKHKGKHEQITIDETLAGQLVTAKPGTEAENIADEIMQDIAEQVPVTFLDKWNAWRYLAMLGNPRTHIRNLLGNAVFMPAIKLKDTIKAGMEKAFVSQENRTTSVIVNKEYKEFAESDFEKVVDIITGNGKMNPSDTIREQQKIFKNKVLEGFRKFNFDMLEKEDMIFLKMHYKRALGGFLQARNIDLNNVDEATLNEARNYAIEEAQKATYRDMSALANTVSRFSRSNKTANLLIEGILPFKKTPINIVKRGIEYSPVGLLKTLSKGSYELAKGNITVSQYIDGISSGLTGTGVFVLGVILSNLGIAIGGLGYDDEDALKRLNGEQGYSIELFGKSYTVDWMAPVCIPFFMGVEFANTFADNEKDIVTAFVDSAYSSLEPVINLSMLSGIRDTIAAARYSDAEDVLTQVGGETISSYFSQALPTLFGQVARTLDDTRRSNYVSSDATGFEKKLYEFFQNAMGKTPILENQKMPYTDAFGEKDTNDNFFFRLFENMLSPGYSSTIKKTDVNAELADLFEQTGDGAVIPRKASKSFTVGGERIYLDADQYTQYNTKKGQLSQNMLVDLFNSKGYKSMTYTKKAEAVSEVYKYANMLAKTEVSDYQLEGKYAKWQEYQGYGYDVSELIALKIADKDLDGSGGVSKSEYAEAVNNTDMSQKQKDLLIGLNDVEGKSDYSKNKTKGFGAGDWYYKKNGQYIKIASAAELNQLRRNNVDTYVYTGNYTDVIDELWRAYRGY